MSEHTPGPLAIEERSGTFAVVDENLLCLGELYGKTTRRHDAVGNARLLTAAYNSYDKHCGPNAVAAAEGDLLGELLEVCRNLLFVAEEYCRELPDDSAARGYHIASAIEPARAAIAKATPERTPAQ